MMTVDAKNVMDHTKKVENVTEFLKSSVAGGKPDVKNVLSKVSVSKHTFTLQKISGLCFMKGSS